jgi:hypothetical protein
MKSPWVITPKAVAACCAFIPFEAREFAWTAKTARSEAKLRRLRVINSHDGVGAVWVVQTHEQAKLVPQRRNFPEISGIM